MMTPSPVSPRGIDLRPAIPGLLLATLTLLFSIGLGIVFGLNEDAIKSRLSAAAASAPAAVYQQDAAATKVVLEKSWVYMQRAHLHGGGLGTIAVVLTLVVVLLETGPLATRAISLGLGGGGLGYSVFWLWAGFRAPALGGTGAAKESLKWLAMPSSGAVAVASVAVVVLLILAIVPRRPARVPVGERPLLTI